MRSSKYENMRPKSKKYEEFLASKLTTTDLSQQSVACQLLHVKSLFLKTKLDVHRHGDLNIIRSSRHNYDKTMFTV